MCKYLDYLLRVMALTVTFTRYLFELERKGSVMAVESSGHERGNPRFFALIENSPKTGGSPTIWAWPQFTEFMKVASQPVQGPWPAHQEPRPDPDADSLPTAVPDNRNK